MQISNDEFERMKKINAIAKFCVGKTLEQVQESGKFPIGGVAARTHMARIIEEWFGLTVPKHVGGHLDGCYDHKHQPIKE